MPDTNIQGVTHFRPGSADFRACEGKIFLVVDVDGCLVTATVGTATGSEGVLYAEQLAADLQILVQKRDVVWFVGEHTYPQGCSSCAECGSGGS